MRPGKRKNGDKGPEGETKSKILVYLADTGPSDFYSLRIHLKRTVNIVSTKVIRKHLSDLEAAGLIHRKARPKGKNDYHVNEYYLSNDFDTFKKIFNFLRDHGHEKELMATRYFSGYIYSDELPARYLINMYKYNLPEIFARIVSENGYCALQEEIRDSIRSPEPLLGILAQLKEGNASDGPVNDMSGMLEDLRSDRIEDVYAAVKARLEVRCRDVYGITPEGHLRRLSDQLLPADRRDGILSLLMASPSAISFVLEPKFGPLLIASSLKFGFLAGLSLAEPALSVPGQGPDHDGSIEDINRVLGDCSMSFIIRSMFVHDYINGDLATMSINEDLLAQIFR